MTMPLNVLEVPKEVAAAKLRSYRAAFKAQHREQDRRIAQGFLEISRGRQVISLGQTIRTGGLDEQGRPKLAVMSAQAKDCYLTVRDGSVQYMDQTWVHTTTRTPNVTEHRVRIDFPGTKWGPLQWQAIVPLVPPEHRPARGLGGFHVLWEADWFRAANPRAPYDPALLRHLAGDLWAVYAVWDLTAVERAVLVGA